MTHQTRMIFGVTSDVSWRLTEGLPALLESRDWKVHLVSSGLAGLHDLIETGTVVAHDLPMARDPNPLTDVKSLVRWIRLIREVRPEIVVVGTPKAGLLGIVAAAICRVKARVYILHGLRLETTSGLFRRLLQLLETLCIRLSTTTIAVSPSLRDLAVGLKLGSINKIRVLGSGSCNGVDIAHFRRADESSAGHGMPWSTPGSLPTVGFVGRLTPEKGLPTLAAALARLNRENVRCKVLIVGSMDEERSSECLRLLTLSGQPMEAVGLVDDPAPLFHRMDVFCLPTMREGLPGVILEAFSAGVPTVASKATGVVDLVEDGVTGLLFEVGNDEQLAATIQNLLADSELRDQLVHNASLLVNRDFRRSDVQDRYEAFFREHLTQADAKMSGPGRIGCP